ncbi:mtDNA inheritance, partitioning of the mitochondrial organelle [Dissophora globulifera]|uniref:MtDNA inheritance, partitioning of the mitochondrial organelle n=1 Tax=Dissophora globulifera TaxID=979702 RepID=A0A9P6V0M7_9FUNG|nr:mtDNA inheritance, partitioning of the mitochondrial organelle [Dissophora globulifera]
MSDTQATSKPPAGKPSTDATPPLDREKLCPFLLRMYYCQGQHHRVDDFSPTSTPPQSSELRLYTWKDATLGEITSLVKQAIPDLVSQAGAGGQLAFRHIYLDINRGIFVGRDVGMVRLDNSHQGSVVGAASDITPKEGLSTKDIHANNSESGTRATISGALAGSRTAGSGSKAYEKSLKSINFVTGDYLDIAITSPTAPGFTSPLSQRQQASSGGGSSGGAIRHRKRSGRSGGGGGAGASGSMGDRLSGRLGGEFGRNGRNQGSGRNGGLDIKNEPSWKGRGRGR